MRFASFILASVLLMQAYAFPWLADKDTGAQLASIKRGLKAMAADEDLVRQIRDLHAQQQRELRDWEAQGNQNVARGLISGIGGTIGDAVNIVVGDVGTIVGVMDSLAGSVQGSKRFPEAAYPYQAPGPTDQRGKHLFFSWTLPMLTSQLSRTLPGPEHPC
jgi:hypothetical protein